MKYIHTIRFRINDSIFKVITVFFVVCSIPLFFNSCRKKINEEQDHPVLYASLDEKKISMEKLFDKIEIIPLETTDQSLIRSISQYNYWDGKHYILDASQYILFIFDDDGHYIDRIARVGQGPGEYKYIYDFVLNPDNGQIEMLSPFKYIYCYDFSGNFIKRHDLTYLPQASIQRFEVLDDQNYIVWTSPEDGQDAICIISREDGKTVNSFWQDLFIINVWGGDVFHACNQETYFALPLYNRVYKATKDGYEIAYEWNFGNKTMDITKYKISTGMYNINKDSENLREKFKNREISYLIRYNFQNSRYCYAMLLYEMITRKHLFYDRETGESYFFERPVEDVKLYPIYFSDTFMIGTSFDDDKNNLLNCALLDETGKKKLQSLKEDDNPYIIKYYFKK
ncbi:MAG: 6-bladed beta-propeller [Prevotellaceae bacterium]|jgi:hypothetical protein|nr:6-bladed beta-propeller [Prevotellaceae bacterium]